MRVKTGQIRIGAGLAAVAALAGCGAGFEAEYAKPLSEATSAERSLAFGEAVVECIVQADRTVGQCRVVQASPDTAEVRDAALQGASMYGNRDLPPEIAAGTVTRRRFVVGGY